MRRVHFAAERLSSDGLAVVHLGLREKWTFKKVIGELRKKTGERLALSSLHRYAAAQELEMRSIRRAQEEAAAFIADVKAGNTNAAEMAQALVGKALFEVRAQLTAADPIKLSREDRERQRLDLKREELKLRREEIELDRRRLENLEAKVKAIRQTAQQALTPAADGKSEMDPIQAIHAIFGKVSEADAQPITSAR